MDSNGMDSMDTIEFNQPEPAGVAGSDPASGRARWLGRPRWPGRAKWSGRTRRVVTTVAASAVLLGSGAWIGMALTGGASASTANSQNVGSGTGSAATIAADTSAVGRCADLVQALRNHDRLRAAKGVQAFCRHRLLRLALVGGEHGEVTFQTKAGPKTIAFERGTIQAVSSSAITVLAKDGTTWSWDLTMNTKLGKAGQQATTASLSTGELVLVVGPVVNGTHDARLIRIRGAGGS
jgi:hypothetical protein